MLKIKIPYSGYLSNFQELLSLRLNTDMPKAFLIFNKFLD